MFSGPFIVIKTLTTTIYYCRPLGHVFSTKTQPNVKILCILGSFI